jgi:hypothetical protein
MMRKVKLFQDHYLETIPLVIDLFVHLIIAINTGYGSDRAYVVYGYSTVVLIVFVQHCFKIKVLH